MVTRYSYCRICQGCCGVEMEVEGNRIQRIIGDRDNPLSQGFICPKGNRGGDLLSAPDRLVRSLRRTASGFEPVDAADATGEIARRLLDIAERHGPEAIGLFLGTQSIFATLTRPMARGWLDALGSHKLFTTMTIDQSAKWVLEGRMGRYLGGRQGFGDADVWMFIGTNPLVSLNGGAGEGVLVQNPVANLRAAKARGMKLIVVDPRRTETAAQADLHLQARPGTDALILAAMLNVILLREAHDAPFCAAHADGLEDLRVAVAPVTPELAAAAAGIEAEQLVEAALLFAAGPRGMVMTGTGPCMAANSNLAEHLAQCLNVVCGRFLRAGERVPTAAVLNPDVAPRAEVVPPAREWETGWRNRFGIGRLRGELPSTSLWDEILETGEGQVRALIVVGSNPLLAMPDTARTRAALDRLELLVCIDPRLTETSRLAHFVIAPTMLYERADHTLYYEKYSTRNASLYTRPIVAPPPGVIEEWQFFHQLAAAMDLQVSFAGHPLEPGSEPDADALLALLATGSAVPVADVAAAPHGYEAPPRTTRVAPPRPEALGHRLALLPPDVAAELRQLIAVPARTNEDGLQLIVRRMREVMNGMGRELPKLARQPYNPASLHPAELERLGLTDGAAARLTSRHGQVVATIKADPTLRPGVIALPHCWDDGAADIPGAGSGANVNLLTGWDEETQAINGMPVLTGVAVTVEALA